MTVGTNCVIVNASEVFPHDVQVNGTSIVSDGVANVPIAVPNSGAYGLVKIASSDGITINNQGALEPNRATDSDYKTANNNYKLITPYGQHRAVFYGLAKAAGDITMSSSSNAIGTYTSEAKAAIKSMIGVVDGSTPVISVTGTTPTITAIESSRYVCGEVATLSITPPSTGTCIVRFTSGSTATVLTLPNTVVFPAWFDATALETNTVYEICITDGVYGAVMTWAT